MTADRTRAGAFAAVLLLLAGYLAIVRPAEHRIADRYARLDAERAVLERDLAIARRAPEVTAARDRVAARLAHKRLHDTRAATVERFLHAAASVASRYVIAIQTVTADTAPASQRTPGALAGGDGDVRLDVTLRGPYDDVLRAVRDLNRSDVATEITIATLGNADRRAGTRPQLHATFHVTLLRESDAHPPRPRTV